MPYRENRYLLFLTENYAALQVLKRYLQEVVGLPAVGSSDSHASVGGAGGLEGPGHASVGGAGGLEGLDHASVGGSGGLEAPGDYVQGEKDRRQEKNEQRKMEPFVLFGSSFPKDKEYTQVCVCRCTYVYVCVRVCMHASKRACMCVGIELSTSVFVLIVL